MAHTYIYANLFTSSRRCTAVGFFMVVLLVTVVMLVMVILGSWCSPCRLMVGFLLGMVVTLLIWASRAGTFWSDWFMLGMVVTLVL